MFKVGTHIQVERTGYTHHGIYIGNNKVIHYSGFHRPGNKGKISLTSLSNFCRGSEAIEYLAKSFLKGNQFSKNEIVKRAKSRLNEDSYNLVFNNCEHFANWCTHDDDYSFQTAGTAENNVRIGNYCLTGGMTVLDLISPFKSLFK
ncbi:lecithin retinol acyltransferase family protein [Pseudoalteromonas gelatinilytica]